MRTLVSWCGYVALAGAGVELACQFGQACVWGTWRTLLNFHESRTLGASLFDGLEGIEFALYAAIVAAVSLLACTELHAAIRRRPLDPRRSDRRVLVCGVSILGLVGLVWIRILIHAHGGQIPGW